MVRDSSPGAPGGGQLRQQGPGPPSQLTRRRPRPARAPSAPGSLPPRSPTVMSSARSASPSSRPGRCAPQVITGGRVRVAGEQRAGRAERAPAGDHRDRRDLGQAAGPTPGALLAGRPVAAVALRLHGVRAGEENVGARGAARRAWCRRSRIARQLGRRPSPRRRREQATRGPDLPGPEGGSGAGGSVRRTALQPHPSLSGVCWRTSQPGRESRLGAGVRQITPLRERFPVLAHARPQTGTAGAANRRGRGPERT